MDQKRISNNFGESFCEYKIHSVIVNNISPSGNLLVKSQYRNMPPVANNAR